MINWLISTYSPGSDEWVAIMTVWSPDILSVTSEGELLITDASYAAIINRQGLETTGDRGELPQFPAYFDIAEKVVNIES